MVDKDAHPNWKDDLRKLHYIPYPFSSAFRWMAKEVFPVKWRDEGETTAVSHFITQWCEKLCEWGRAFLWPGCPSTNNGLERKNRVLKAMQEHKRLALNLFMQKVVAFVKHQGSQEVAKVVKHIVSLEHEDWRGVQVRAPKVPAACLTLGLRCWWVMWVGHNSFIFDKTI